MPTMEINTTMESNTFHGSVIKGVNQLPKALKASSTANVTVKTYSMILRFEAIWLSSSGSACASMMAVMKDAKITSPRMYWVKLAWYMSRHFRCSRVIESGCVSFQTRCLAAATVWQARGRQCQQGGGSCAAKEISRNRVTGLDESTRCEVRGVLSRTRGP